MSQNWDQLLFAHWPVKAEVLEARIPQEFTLDTYDGYAWIAVVPFLMNKVKFRYLPEIPMTNRFLELNVRTYIKYKEKSGVYFFSLDASNLLAVEAARIWFGLPYLRAEMNDSKLPEDPHAIHYESTRVDRRAPSANLDVQYRPTGEIINSSAGSLEEFLTERYCLFCLRGRSIMRGDIHHKKWDLQPAEAEFRENTMLEPLGIDVDNLGPPLLYYSHAIETLEWPPTVQN